MQRKWFFMFIFAAIYWLCVDYCFAGYSASSGGPLASVLQRILDLMTGPLARTSGMIAIVSTGYLTFLGRLSMNTALMVALGMALIFGGTQIADWLIGGIGG